MASGLVCYDSISNREYPAGGDAYAGYVGGRLADQPNYAWIVKAFPKAHHLSIALHADQDADALDVENGAASPGDVLAWTGRQARRGVKRPVVYANVFTMRTAILPLCGHAPGALRLWTAHYGEGEHICGPHTCGQLPVSADGTQWTQNAHGRDLDQSLLAADFFGTVKPPAPTVFGPVIGLRLVAAKSNAVELQWSAPAVTLEGVAVAGYQIAMSEGPKLGPQVGPYVTTVAKTRGPELWEGEVPKPRTQYTAGVRAVDKNGQHGPADWQTVTFRTTG